MPGDVTVPSTLKGAAAQMWRSTFLSAYSGTCKDREDRDACAARIAWAQVKTKYSKGKDGTWVAKAGDPVLGPLSPVGDNGAPPALTGNLMLEPPPGVTGGRLARWKKAYLDALSGECRNKPKPVICARRVANRAVGLEEKAMSEEAPTVVERKDYDTKTRRQYAEKGWALPDGSYPIANCQDVSNAIHRIGTGKNNPKSKIVAHIRSRAKALGCKMTPALEQKMAYIERYLDRQHERVRANEADYHLMATRGDQPIVRPERIGSLTWRSLPPEQKTIRAEATRRIIERNYAQAVEDAQFLGWKVRVNHYDPAEYSFSKFIDTDAGEILTRAVLVRKPSELTWRLKPLSQFASGSMAARLPGGELRHIKDSSLRVPIIREGPGSGLLERGGPGSGYHSPHYGRPGEIGGSSPRGGGDGGGGDQSKKASGGGDATGAGRGGTAPTESDRIDLKKFEPASNDLPEGYAEKISQMSLGEIASQIRRDWGNKVNFAAKPYLEAMQSLDSIEDNYLYDTGYSVVAYFLSNASSYRGAKARAIKAELKKRLKGSGPGGKKKEQAADRRAFLYRAE